MKKNTIINIIGVLALVNMVVSIVNFYTDKNEPEKVDYRIITIDDCEYVAIYDQNGGKEYGFMTHKGNCVNH